MPRLINKNFYHLCKTYEHNKSKSFKDSEIVILEGSSRSGKTIASVDFLIRYCISNIGKNILLVRNTYNSHKTTLYNDFNVRLKAFGLASPFDTAKEVSSFKINGNTLHFVGADTPAKFEGAGSDLAYFNEMLDISQVVFDQIEQRCREMIIGDYNPKYSQHWVYDSILKRPDCAYLHSTFLDNPFCSDSEKRKILSYEPTETNIANGTADEYRWKVYGLGLSCSQEGLVFKNVIWINQFPTEVERVFFGNDFGYSVDQNALVKCGINGTNLYLEEKLYKPIDNVQILSEVMKPIVGESIVWCDSADRYGMIPDLRLRGISAYPAKKWAGCINYRIDMIKRYKIHIVKSDNFRKEQENYSYRVIQGIQTNEPIDGYNHLWDAVGYACQHELRVENL